MIPIFTQDDGPSIKDNGVEMRKKHTVFLQRVDGPFSVSTVEGPLSCKDGFIAYDPITGHVWPVDSTYVSIHYEAVQEDLT